MKPKTKNALTAGGYTSFQEGFEDNGAWGAVRTTLFPSNFNIAPSVTSQGIEWTSNHPATNEITTIDSAAVTGNWGIWDPDGGFATGTIQACDVEEPGPECFPHDGLASKS